MRRQTTLSIVVLLTCAACHSHDHGAEHDHAGPGARGAGGGAPHGHDGAEAAAEPELPTQALTLWSERHELFAEHPPLVVGAGAKFAAHVTLLPSFAAATEEAVAVELKQADGSVVTVRADAPRVAGIYGPVLTPTRPGACTLRLTIERGEARDVFTAPECTVHVDARAAAAALGGEGEAAATTVPFLKEQQWKTEFAVVEATERPMQPSVRATGEVRPAAGREARLTAGTAGRLELARPAPVLGARVTRGQLLATLTAFSVASTGDRAALAAELRAARAELDSAAAQLARAERLAAADAISARQLEEARTRVSVAQARKEGASGTLAQFSAGASGRGGRGAFEVRSPIAGVLVATEVASGQPVQAGDALFRVIDLERVWVRADVFEPELPRVEGARGGWFEVEGYDAAFSLDAPDGRLVTVGHVVDPRTRTVPVIFEVPNPGARLRIGQFATMSIASGEPRVALAIPESGVLDEAGRAVAYVQVEGEAFERRPLLLGLRANGWVEVRAGLAAGDHVVTRGAYEIRLQAASGSVPAHGHVH